MLKRLGLSICLGLASLASAHEMRVWTDTKGRKTNAQLLEHNNHTESVRLQTSKGKKIWVKMGKLSSSDLDYLADIKRAEKEHARRLTEKKLLRNLKDFRLDTDSPLANGDPRRIYKSKEGTAYVEFIGDADDLKATSVVAALAQDAKGVAAMANVIIFLCTIFPKWDVDGMRAWIIESFKSINEDPTNTPTKKIRGKTLSLVAAPKTGIWTFAVTVDGRG